MRSPIARLHNQDFLNQKQIDWTLNKLTSTSTKTTWMKLANDQIIQFYQKIEL